jgi:hypothetical protein
MSEMIERVARAIDAVLGDEHESLSREMGCGSHAKEMRTTATLEAARAAIEAMREPTEAMKAVTSENTWHAVQDWYAMIEEALK